MTAALARHAPEPTAPPRRPGRPRHGRPADGELRPLTPGEVAAIRSAGVPVSTRTLVDHHGTLWRRSRRIARAEEPVYGLLQAEGPAADARGVLEGMMQAQLAKDAEVARALQISRKTLLRLLETSDESGIAAPAFGERKLRRWTGGPEA